MASAWDLCHEGQPPDPWTLFIFVLTQVADDVSVAMERVCGTLEQESTRLTQSMGETLFELYMSLKTLKRFREFLPLKWVTA